MFRLVLLIILFLLSLLCIFPAPTFHLWMVSILSTEFCWLFLLLTVILLFVKVDSSMKRRIGTILGVVAFAFFSYPLFSAYKVSRTLDKDFERSFPAAPSATTKPPMQPPFRFSRLFRGPWANEVPFKTFTYDSLSASSLQLDFYRSTHSGPRPCAIIVHGGSWSGGDRRQLPELNSYLAQNGYHVAAISYRLAPYFQNPAPVEDVQKALRFLISNSPTLGIDTTRFALLGRSAGAQVALLAAYTLHLPSIKGVISFYGPADMVWGYSLPANPLVMDSRKVMSDYLGGSFEDVPRNYYNSSPAEFVTSSSPPTLMIHGKNDPLVAYQHNIRLMKKLKAAGVSHFLLTLPWATHGFDYTLHGPGGQLSTYTVHRFLSAVLQ